MADLKSYFQGSCNNLIFNIMLTNSHLAIIDLLGGKKHTQNKCGIIQQICQRHCAKKKKKMKESVSGNSHSLP